LRKNYHRFSETSNKFVECISGTITIGEAHESRSKQYQCLRLYCFPANDIPAAICHERLPSPRDAPYAPRINFRSIKITVISLEHVELRSFFDVETKRHSRYFLDCFAISLFSSAVRVFNFYLTFHQNI